MKQIYKYWHVKLHYVYTKFIKNVISFQTNKKHVTSLTSITITFLYNIVIIKKHNKQITQPKLSRKHKYKCMNATTALNYCFTIIIKLIWNQSNMLFNPREK